ncbi:hypothetical protein LTS18_013684 [Coniosporium uncinatum]|uniref:Uncharacterized protein n=1 Tax=Coniosporium uncinatum TaxID=93489 RepID=A0ACC3DVU0_9PEZI|nr:hypothetical protein LTS18_013684 [Coniosporium uncinatum]
MSEGANLKAPDYTDTEDPPAYSGPSTFQASTSSAAAPQSRTTLPGLPVLSFQHYAPSGSTISRDLTTITIKDPSLTSFLPSLLRFLPRPCIRITGDQKTDYGSGTCDFDSKLDVLRYLMPSTPAHALNYTRISSKEEHGNAMSLQDLAHALLKDTRSPKQICVKRRVTGWSTEYLYGCIHALLQEVDYKGTVTITFPMTHTKVILEPEQKGFASKVKAFFAGATEYEIEAWWEKWKVVVRAGVLAGRKEGWVGMEDLMDAVMMPRQG